jgi:predicted secreted protein
MSHPLRNALFALLCLALPFAAAAAEPDDDAVRLHLHAVSEREVDNDLMRVTLQVVRSGTDTARLAREVSAIMERALETGRAHPQVKLRTPAYTTQPVHERHNNETRQTGWQIIQTLELESTDLESATQLVGKLQEGDLQVTWMGFTVSDVTRSRVRRELTDEAIDLWREKASAAARRMGASHWQPREVTIQDELEGPPIRPMLARTMDAAVESAPAVEAGTSRVRVQVGGLARALGVQAESLR